MTVTHRESPSRPPEPRARQPAPPEPRGELSSQVDRALRDGALLDDPAQQRAVTVADPYGEDLQLALYALYELHYQGFHGVDPELEWEPGLLALRRLLERRFLSALRADAAPQTDAAQALADLQVEPVGHDTTSVSHHLEREGTRGQFREYAALRSLYHLKEADPHVWVIPRLHGRAKAAMVAVEYDEFGAGRAEDIHAALFADLMRDLDLATAYGHYLDAAPAAALATVNVMSLFGLHRSLRGALVGHFATVEITSPPGSRRLAGALRRLRRRAAAGAGPARPARAGQLCRAADLRRRRPGAGRPAEVPQRPRVGAVPRPGDGRCFPRGDRSRHVGADHDDALIFPPPRPAGPPPGGAAAAASQVSWGAFGRHWCAWTLVNCANEPQVVS